MRKPSVIPAGKHSVIPAGKHSVIPAEAGIQARHPARTWFPAFAGTTKRRQRGVALIVAVLIAALAAMLAASVSFKGYLDQRRTGNAVAMDQGFQVALGGEAWAADALRRDKQQSARTDDFTEEWATPIPPIPLDDGDGNSYGSFEGQLEDMQGRFNLNSLVVLEGGQLKTDPLAIARFERLLELLELEPKWARIVADWIDSDIQPEFPDGAEDPTYTGLTPPYRTANMPLTRASELLSLAGFGLERYRKLEPFVTALPIGTPINLCTASPELLDALVAGRTQFTMARENTMETRKQRCFPTRQDFESGLSNEEKQELVQGKVIDQTSSYFRATIWVTIGTTQYTLYSLLYRSGNNGLVRPILRSHGTP